MDPSEIAVTVMQHLVATDPLRCPRVGSQLGRMYLSLRLALVNLLSENVSTESCPIKNSNQQ